MKEGGPSVHRLAERNQMRVIPRFAWFRKERCLIGMYLQAMNAWWGARSIADVPCVYVVARAARMLYFCHSGVSFPHMKEKYRGVTT